jgi:hypothetical protein
LTREYNGKLQSRYTHQTIRIHTDGLVSDLHCWPVILTDLQGLVWCFILERYSG